MACMAEFDDAASLFEDLEDSLDQGFYGFIEDLDMDDLFDLV